ncbi:MAG: hypothetical protein ACLRWP_11140 [Bilophila wadsworthia]
MRGQLVGHAGTGHTAGEGFRDVVLVHEIPGVGRILDHSDMETPHRRETADVASGYTLPGLEFRPLVLARLYAGHVMGRCCPPPQQAQPASARFSTRLAVT